MRPCSNGSSVKSIPLTMCPGWNYMFVLAEGPNLKTAAYIYVCSRQVALPSIRHVRDYAEAIRTCIETVELPWANHHVCRLLLGNMAW